jgi:hypothetical protein
MSLQSSGSSLCHSFARQYSVDFDTLSSLRAQAARSEATCLDLKEALSQAERALASEAGSSQRAHQRCVELERQLQHMKQVTDVWICKHN